MATGLTFEQALSRLKAGHKIARENWKGWRYVELVANDKDIRISMVSERTSLPYAANSSDMLASDWKVIQ
jgi:hypothetical protein